MEKTSPLTETFYYILLALGEPLHGYGIIQSVSAMTSGRIILGPGTLYGALNTLLERGWIRLYSIETESRKKKEYLRTSAGSQALQEELLRLEELLANGKKYFAQ